jgi:hypothetical protein
MHLGQLRPRPQHPPVLRNGLLQPPRILQHIAQVHAGLDVIRPQLQRGPVSPRRLVQPPGRGVRIAQIVMRLRPVRLQPRRLAEPRHRPVQPPHAETSQRQVEMALRRPRLQANRPVDQLHRRLAVARLMPQHAIRMQRLRIAWLGREQGTIGRLRLGAAAGLVQRQGLGQQHGAH